MKPMKIKAVILIICLALALSMAQALQAAVPTVTMKFPAGVGEFIDKNYNTVLPDANGNAAVPYPSITNYLDAGFTFPCQWPPITSYASGTAYSLMATAAALNFGTANPVVTLPVAGTYLIRYRAHVEYVGATFAAAEAVTLKLRCTNNTAGDLTNFPATAVAAVVTTTTGTLAWVTNEVVYTAAAGDTITIYGLVAATPSAGALNVVEASIVAQQLY
jgi:hypothetical protein